MEEAVELRLTLLVRWHGWQEPSGHITRVDHDGSRHGRWIRVMDRGIALRLQREVLEGHGGGGRKRRHRRHRKIKGAGTWSLVLGFSSQGFFRQGVVVKLLGERTGNLREGFPIAGVFWHHADGVVGFLLRQNAVALRTARVAGGDRGRGDFGHCVF